MSELRALIREIVAQELAAIRPSSRGAPLEENVCIADSRDLTAFALGLLERATDPLFAAAVRDGSHVFMLEGARLSDAATPGAPRHAPSPGLAQTMLVTTSPPAVPELTKSLITERDIAAIPTDQTRIRIGKKSRLTPLASDEARRRKIRIERMTT
ncbi:hypothetical protein NKJ10_25735 [Mesorhizobium sp. M0204]|uniref:hypothetical protein n=1 Tax=Mesorhizobium sp. M0204 TaxID=2956913 RepID=UPI00333515CC